jgi:hypothetical protein
LLFVIGLFHFQRLRTGPMRSTVFKKLLRLFAYAIGSCICLSAALVSAGLLYHQENAFKSGYISF